MRICPPWFIVAVAMLLVPSVVRGNDHSADIYAAGSGGGGSKLFGGYLSLGVTATSEEGTWQRVGFVGDLGIYKGKNSAAEDVTRITLGGGVRFWFGPDDEPHQPYVQVVFGLLHNHIGATDNNDPKLGVALGYEFHISGSPEESGLGTRVQVDYVSALGDEKSFPRLSGGIVWRIGR